ncbi:bifunctional riboflavin kinase/FAD synthetase [Polymorphum gilvum]|uniref:Riboflavin biosynthesis protein n=1 Tax=Polymorphum gilvum (strain LMG 25793 / CGMCC 1.9160 / SL003B-26A1) TaxID=991905 RepID=F2J029_POLGS|nr:bifunctional riboflavin kinase/FAD synthetase [Polymorphum gilvum]ADZ71864.1 Riboflavin kinase/FMN adenylyltransferase protein [Polymorphum gilvum SL003B-26A1]
MPDTSAVRFSLVDDLAAFPAHLRGGVVAIGNFDGVHRGHRAVLDEAAAVARATGEPVYAMTFEPHPRTVFNPSRPVFRLTPAPIKAAVMEAFGLDGLLVVPFTHDFAGMEAADFVRGILIDTLRIRHAVTGYDFHFGKARAGTPDYLRNAGRDHGFGVNIVEAENDEGGEVISSSRIRAALADGDLVLANALLGYRWFVEGTVEHGEKRGRDLGYPTANLRLAPECTLRHGIYAVQVQVDGQRHEGVASFGRRPMFDNGAPLLETFLFDFAGDLYGRTMRVSFVSFLRPEARFDGIEALIAQMDRDSDEARAALASARPLSALDLALGAQGVE